jgi:hypothetical protein
MKLFCLILIFIFAEISANKSSCNLGAGFIEPKQNAFIYKKLKPHSASIDDLRKFIANENNCDECNITFLRITDYKEVGKYEVCVDRNTMIYNRMFFNFVKSTNIPNNRDLLTSCTPSFQFKEYNIYYSIVSVLVLFILYIVCAYFLLLSLKLTLKLF